MNKELVKREEGSGADLIHLAMALLGDQKCRGSPRTESVGLAGATNNDGVKTKGQRDMNSNKKNQ